MGRKRNDFAVNGSGKADKVKSSNASTSLTSPGHKFLKNTDNSSAGEPTNVENNVLPISPGSKANKKKPRIENDLVRRSGRLKSLVLPGRTRGVMKSTVEHVILTDNENEKENEPSETEKVDALPVLNEKELGVETQAEQVSPRPDLKELSLDEKVNYLVRMVDEFKPKVFGKTNGSPSPDFSYKSLYIQTQKKYEALMEEYYETLRKLEFARGQIAAYEKMKDTMGGASREVILVSDMGKLTGGGGGATVHQTALNCTLSPSDPVSSDAAEAEAEAEADKNPSKKKTYIKKKKAI